MDKYSGERVRRSFKVSSWEHSWIRESRAIAHAHRMADQTYVVWCSCSRTHSLLITLMNINTRTPMSIVSLTHGISLECTLEHRARTPTLEHRYGFEMEGVCAQVVDLVNYYSSQRTRLHMNETWKGLKKREKFVAPCYLG